MKLFDSGQSKSDLKPMNSEDRGMQLRFYSFILVTTLLIVIWVGYLFTIQLVDVYGFKSEVNVRYTPTTVLQTPTRGYIYDRNRDLLVRTAKFYQIDFDRGTLQSYKDDDRQQLAEDYDKIATIISRHSSLSKQFVLSRLTTRNNRSSIYISDRIREADIVNIQREMRENRLSGGLITNFSFQQRIYTKGNLAARVLGFATDTREPESNSALSRLEGICGIENVYEKELQGTYGWQKIIRDGRRNPVQIPNLGRQKVINGNSLVLTIDSRIQEIVEMNLEEGLQNFKAKNAVAVIMNPQNGEILAMASISSSDNHLNTSEIRVTANLATSFMFEPGSTIKPFTSLVALEKRLFKTSDMIDCRRYLTEHNRTIRDSHEFKDLSFLDVIAQSSNVGISKVAEKVGAKNLYERLISVGFGNRTGSDIYGETAGVLRKVKDWQGYSLHSISFGQEMAVTPLQLVAAYGALANDGKLMRPYIVKEIINDQDQIVKRNSPQRIRTVSSKSALDTLKTIMQSVVDNGTATGTKLPNVTIAGKTGTAEKQSEGHVGYTRHTYISNFVGFFPVEDPQYVMLVLYDEPDRYYHYASMSAVVTFRKITEQILTLPDCNIVPRMKMQETQFVKMPNLIGMKINRAERILEQNSINYQIYGATATENVIIVDQYPKQDVEFDQNREVYLIVAGENTIKEEEILGSKMPSLIGMTLRQAVTEAKKYQINLEVNGLGVVYSQSIQPGRDIAHGATCIVKAN